MKNLIFSLCILQNILSISAIAQENWTQDGNASRGRFLYQSSGALGYGIRTASGGGWAWQLVDGSYVPYFHVEFPTGKVGLGTTTPVAKLHIVSQAAGTAGLHVQGLSGDSWISYWDGKNYFRGTTIFADNGGSVGIGTTSPSSNLHVLSSSPIGASLNSEVLITRFSTNVANLQSLDLKLRKYSTTDNYWWGNSLRLQRNIDGAVNSCYIDFGASETNSGAGSHELGFGVDNTEHMRIAANGNVGIGTSNPTQKLQVKGTVYSTEVKVDLAAGKGPDYVFEPTYDLKPLAEIETYIKENKHLPEVPSAKEMEANGVQLGEMNMLLLKKVEELTLYVIELKKENDKQNELIRNFKKN
jgi:hypothetical protein